MRFLGLETPLLIDGGMATSLEAKGVAMHPTLWSGGAVIETPDTVTEVHADFARAGADVLITASYQLTPQALRKLGCDTNQIREFILRTVVCAERACGRDVEPLPRREGRGDGVSEQFLKDSADSSVAQERDWHQRSTLIAGGIGPYGAYLCDGSEYRGRYAIDRRALVDFHRERFEILSGSRCDLVVFETVPCLDEIRAIVDLARDASKPVWVSMCCRNDGELSSGEPLAEAAAILGSAPAIAAVGVNCVAPQHVASHIAILQEASSKPIFVYPNLGQTWDPANRVWHGRIDETEFLLLVDNWLAVGAVGIGGCCGVGSQLIRAVAGRLRAEH